ncbi:hypothetical protein HY604_04180 [Candidatus Peregrinibacteria bacterium]|nr:hypothetical protein [Candidatus Peregrinibacteria bacterium]
MKKGYFQKSISSLSLAVLTGVILFSVGSGTSASPEYPPEKNSGVRPTFTGAIITGDIENTGANPLSIKDDIKVSGNLDLKGKITDTTGDETINLETHFSVLGQITAMSLNVGKIKNGTVDDGGWVTIDDKFAVTKNSNFKGNMIVENTLSVWDAITSKNGLIKTNSIQTGTLDVKDAKGIENSGTQNGGKVNINDGLNVTGTLTASAPSFTGKVLADSLEVKASAKMKGLAFEYSGAAPSQGSYESIIYHYEDPVNGNNDALVIKSNDNIKLITNDDWATPGVGIVEVQGKLVATKGIGTYTRRESTSVSVASGKTNYTSKGCNTGEIAVSCGVDPSSYKMYNSYFYTDSKMTTCYVGVHNTDSATRTFKVYANCFNPAI